MRAQALIDSIKDTYLNQGNLAMQKVVPEFYLGGTFLGDSFNYIIFEPLKDMPPRIYHTTSPYDIVSQKAPDQALVFHDGNLMLNIDFTEYVEMRTGIMDSLVFQLLNLTDLDQKKNILFGTGKTARWSLKFLKEIFPEIKQIDFVNASGNRSDFIEFADMLGIEAIYQVKPDLRTYDIIMMHTSSNETVIGADQVSNIKRGAIITTYKTTSKHGEIAYEFLDSNRSNVIIDWAPTLQSASEVKEALEKGILVESSTHTLQGLVKNDHILEDKKKYTVFRSTGTPMQNVAILKLVMESEMRADSALDSMKS